MKTWKKVVLGLVVLGIVAFVAWIIILWFAPNPNEIIPMDSVKYQTKEELIDLYRQNKTVLNSVKDSVLSSKSFLRALNEYGEGDYDISHLGDKKYFSEEEWTNIVSVFESLHPYMIMMERKGRPLKFYIDFPKIDFETGYQYTSLYWFPSEAEIEYHKDHCYAENVDYTHIEEGWYIVEETYTR
jgi:hypothetical protein